MKTLLNTKHTTIVEEDGEILDSKTIIAVGACRRNKHLLKIGKVIDL